MIELSIVIPVYNVELYLRECLDSIYAVKNIKKEVILVNDGSTDNSLEILKEYKNKYPDITKLIDKKNGGLSSARNAGIRVAKGEYISFIDSDDFIDSQKYEEFFKEGKKEELDIMIGNYYRYSKNKVIKDGYLGIMKEDFQIKDGYKFLVYAISTKRYKAEVWDDIYKKELILKNNIYFKEGMIYEDEVFTPFILLVAKKIRFIDKTYYYYRQREGSIMSTFGGGDYKSKIKMYNFLLFNKSLAGKVERRKWFWDYQANVSKFEHIYLKNHLKLLFIKNITFQDRLWILKSLRHVKKIEWDLKI